MTQTYPIPGRVTILGLGLFGGGAGAARFFAERGAKVIVTDLRGAPALHESIRSLQDLSLTFHLEGHGKADFEGADVVVVNAGVPPEARGLQLARESGARLETEINLLFQLSPAPIVAVTGTHGKSTTAALLADMLREAGRKVWLGGNLGVSLLPVVGEMRAEDVVVLEVSSFQAERLAWIARSPQVALALNLTPNHLDRHPSMEAYAAAKRELVRYQGETDLAILNGDDPILRTWANAGRGRKLFLGGDSDAAQGARVEDDAVRVWNASGAATISLATLRLPGAHNRFNAACAASAAWALGAPPEAIERAMSYFKGLSARLELVAQKHSVRFYNDSIATTPEAAVAALASFRSPVVLIAGGSSKKHRFDTLGEAVLQHCKAVMLVGDTARAIADAVLQHPDHPPVQVFDAFEPAVLEAARVAEPGDVVLLSPACASFDMFRNYRDRGQAFVDIVAKL